MLTSSSKKICIKKSHQNISHYIQFLLKLFFSIKKGIISSEKMRNSSNYDYAH